MSKGEEVRVEIELVERPDAESLRPIELLDGTVARVEHRTLAASGQGGPDASGRKKHASGSLLETTGRWGFSVRSVLSDVSGHARELTVNDRTQGLQRPVSSKEQRPVEADDR